MLNAVLAPHGERVYRAAQHTRLVEVGIHRLLCQVTPKPIIDGAYCPSDRGVIDARSFSYGWQVHRRWRTTRRHMMADARKLTIDVIVPLYNEEEVVADFHRRLMEVVFAGYARSTTS